MFSSLAPRCAPRTAPNLMLGSLVPRLTLYPHHGMFVVNDLATRDGVLLQLQACVRWQDAPERNVLLGRADSRLLVLHLAKRQLAEQVAQTYFGELLLNRCTMDATLLKTLQRCATDLPVAVNTVHLMSFGIAPVLEANHNAHCLAAMRTLLVRFPTFPVPHATLPIQPSFEQH